MKFVFKDRHHAGVQLTTELTHYCNCSNCIVFGIPRGGVVVAAEVAIGLNLPLDLIVTKKIGAPFNPELAIGSVDPNGKATVDKRAKEMLNISPRYLQTTVPTITAEIKRQLELYRGHTDYSKLTQQTALIVDDGIATGQTVIAAVQFLKTLDAERIVVATPVIAPATLNRLCEIADEVRYVLCQEQFSAVGQFYQDFSPVNDNEVLRTLQSIK